MGHLATFEAKHHFDLHIFTKKVDRVRKFHIEIMGVNFWAELDLLNLIDVLMFLGVLFFLGLFVPILALVHQSANRGDSIGCDFHQINPKVTCLRQGVP